MRIRSRRLTRWAAVAMAVLFRLLLKTVRRDEYYAEPNLCAYERTGDERHLYCLWHDGIVGWVFSRRAQQIAALVSRHADGSYLADALESIGVPAIRGSSRRGGAEAVRQMLTAAANFHIAITTDGPLGPRRVVKEGIVYLASQTGRAIVPAAFAARRAWRPRGRWTDLVIPLPFTRTYIRVGPRIHVPPGLDREQLEPYRRLVQAAMDALTAEVDRLSGVDSNAGWPAIAAVKPARPVRRAA